MQKPLEIGDAVINYNEDGTVRDATFLPKLIMNIEDETLTKLKSVAGSNVASIIQGNADLVLKSFFKKTDEVEESSEIKSSVMYCGRYPNNNVCQCIIRYHLHKV